jgi:tetratricopeptide (TPR) repeat protein
MQARVISNSKAWVIPVIVLFALTLGMMGLFRVVEHQRPAAARAAELSYLPNGDYLKVAVLGYRQLVADLIWLKILQHVGIRELATDGYLWAYHAADVVTDLDPQFVFAYQSIGTVLSISAGRPSEAVALLAKGMRHNPDAWVLPFVLGYISYFDLHDPTAAAQYFRAASVLPGAPPYLPQLATKMTVKAGDPEVALEFLQRLYQQVKDERVREGLTERIKEVSAERDRRWLEARVQQYRTRFGRLPAQLDDLVAVGIVQQLPEEPFGGAYQLDVTNGAVTSSNVKERLRVYK